MPIIETIVISLVIAAIALILSELLRPKPKFENARRPGLGDFDFPTAVEGRVVPVIFGTVQLKGPNVIWYGDLKSRKITEKVKTGLWSSKHITTGFQHFVGIQFGLCRGPVGGIKRIWIGEDIVYDGSLVSDGAIAISKKKLFGGDSFGNGGVEGTLRVHPGSESQTVNSYLTSHQNPITPHRGTHYAVWEQGYIGNSTTIKPWSFEIRRIPNGLGLTSGHELVNSSDANPAAVLFELLTDTDWGFAFPAGDIDQTNFRAAGDTLFTEGNGFSFILDTPIQAQELLEEIQRQMDGIVYLDQSTGLFKISLARGGYSIGSIPQLTPTTNVKKVAEFTRGTWEETVNQVRIEFSDRARDYFQTYSIANDLANQRMQAGESVSAQMAYPGVKDKNLANSIASRELRQLSVPLTKATLQVDRSLFTLRPNDVVAWTEPNLGITQLPMRVAKIGYGSLKEGMIELSLVEDVFAFTAGFFAAADNTRWVAPVQDVAGIPANDQRIFEAPKAFITRDPLYPGTGDRLWAGGRRQTGAEIAFRIWQRNSSGSPSGAFTEDSADIFQFFLIGTLKDDTPAGAEPGTATIALEALPDSLAVLEAAFQKGVAAVDIGQNLVNLILVDGEFMGVSDVVNQGAYLDMTGVWRGMLDSVSAFHADGTKVYLLFAGGDLSNSAIAAGRNVHAQIRPSSLTDEATEGESTTVSLTMANRVRKPYPPSQVKLNAAAYPASVDVDAQRPSTSGLDNRGIDVTFIRRDFRTYDETQGITTDAETIDDTFPGANDTQYLTEIKENSTVLTTAEEAFWKFEESSGTRFDETANDVDLTAFGSPGRVAGKIGFAVDLQAASSQYLEAATAAKLNYQNVAFSKSFWVNLASKSANRTIFSKWTTDSDQRQYLLEYDNPSDRFVFRISSDGTAGTVTSVAANKFGSPSTSTWYLVLVRHDPVRDLIEISVNDGKRDYAAHAGGAFNSSAKFRIGSITSGGVAANFMDGQVDASGSWSKLLTEFEGSSLYAGGTGQEHPFAARRTLYSSGQVSTNNPFASRTKLLRAGGGGLPNTSLLTTNQARHTAEGLLLLADQSFSHSATISASVLADDTAFGNLAQNVVSNPYKAPTTGTYNFTIGVALASGAVEARLNGGAFTSIISSGNTTGTLAATAGDIIEVRHTQGGIVPSETFLEVNAPSSSEDAYGILTY